MVMEDILIDKSLLQSHKQCARRAWLEASGEVLPERSRTAQSMIEQGEVVHSAARKKFPNATRIGSMTLRDAAKATAEALDSGSVELLEAAFVAGQLGVRADALTFRDGTWELTEFKSGSDVKDEHLDDCAIQFEALRLAGVKVGSVRVCHPDTGRPLEEVGAEEGVLVFADVTEVVSARAAQVSIWLERCIETVCGEEPEVKPGKHCSDPYDCPFKHHCGEEKVEKRPEDPEHLPSHAGGIKELIAGGCGSILDLPIKVFSHERNVLVREAVEKGGAVVRQEFARFVLGARYPRAFMDFEAASFAIPRFVGMRPYQALPFQWSVHTVDAAGREAEHSEFIDVSGLDPRRSFAETLLSKTRDAQSVFVYSGYEKGRLKELAEAFPELADALMDLMGKLVDLLPGARRGYYHPKMCGSWSIKKILPTLPAKEGVTYEELDGVSDGLEAQAAYMELTNPAVVGGQRETLKKQLLAYCKVDTAGLAHFAEYVQAHA